MTLSPPHLWVQIYFASLFGGLFALLIIYPLITKEIIKYKKNKIELFCIETECQLKVLEMETRMKLLKGEEVSEGVSFLGDKKSLDVIGMDKDLVLVNEEEEEEESLNSTNVNGSLTPTSGITDISKHVEQQIRQPHPPTSPIFSKANPPPTNPTKKKE